VKDIARGAEMTVDALEDIVGDPRRASLRIRPGCISNAVNVGNLTRKSGRRLFTAYHQQLGILLQCPDLMAQNCGNPTWF
jgi:hypothetical protein